MFYNSFDNIGLIRVLSLLKSHGTEYLSGQDLSDVLKISRVAVWKHIKTIKELGYTVETKQKMGYRLVRDTDRLLPWEVTGVQTRQIGRRAYYFDEIDSTQNYAAGLARSGGEEGSVVVAERQTHGRGRLQRRWESPEGGIWLSVVLKPRLDSGTLSLVPIAAGISLARAIKKSAGINAELKWPNDVTIDSRKVAGVIVDASVESSRLDYTVIGAGVNFDTDAKKIEGALKRTPNFYGATSITQHSKDAERLELVHEFFRELEKNIALMERGKTDSIVKNWTRHSGTIGRRITVLVGGKRVTGIARKMGQDGALLIETPGGTERVLAEDVAHLR